MQRWCINRRFEYALILLLLVFITIGYAYLSANLKVEGNSNIKSNRWDIHFEDINISDGSVSTDSSVVMDNTRQNITYKVSLDKPGDFYEFSVDVVNGGTIDGMLSDNSNLIGPELTDEQKGYLNYVVSYENGNIINKGDVLKAGESKCVLVRVEYKSDLDNADLPKDGVTLDLKFNMEYVQDNGIGKDIDSDKLSVAKYIEKIANDNNGDKSSTDEILNTGLAYDGTVDNNLRFIGNNPNNYVKFNNELWRIVGVFNNIKTDINSVGESRVKLIKDGYYNTSIVFDSNGINDYSTSSLMNLLNGEYLNSFDDNSKRLVGDAVWMLGGPTASNYQSPTDGLVDDWYNYERSSVPYMNHASSWTGKIALFYASDYGFATGGGNTTSRASCLSNELYDWGNASDCYNNNFFYDKTYRQWTMSSQVDGDAYLFRINLKGHVGHNLANYPNAVRPALYLKNNVKISSGVGSVDDPYLLKM